VTSPVSTDERCVGSLCSHSPSSRAWAGLTRWVAHYLNDPPTLGGGADARTETVAYHQETLRRLMYDETDARAVTFKLHLFKLGQFPESEDHMHKDALREMSWMHNKGWAQG
jgi:hypothetical protein